MAKKIDHIKVWLDEIDGAGFYTLVYEDDSESEPSTGYLPPHPDDGGPVTDEERLAWATATAEKAAKGHHPTVAAKAKGIRHARPKVTP